MAIDVKELLAHDAALVDDCLRRAIARRRDGIPARLLEAIEYSLFAGGKRLRPTLLIECFRACDPRDQDLPTSTLAAAGAVELIHTFSLVHDDLPAMDDDDLRRGRPTSHKVFGEAMAILAGDAMTTLAFDLLASDATADLAAPLVRELAASAGPAGMIGGQVIDIDNENRPLSLDQLRSLHRMKTGALLTCACRMGAICARASDDVLRAITTYGRNLGIAFQIVDDLLDVTSSADHLGKQTAKDAARGKNTYPVLIGADRSRAEAKQHLSIAIDAIQSAGIASDALISLAKFVIDRDR